MNDQNWTKFQIEAMSVDDLSDVAILAEQLGYPNDIKDIRERFQKICNDNNYALYVAKNDQRKVIGFIQINSENHTLLAAPRAEVVALIVDDRHRGKGVGSALLKAAEEWARSQALPLVRIRSNIKRENAHRFYKGKGYENPKSWHLFTKKIETVKI